MAPSNFGSSTTADEAASELAKEISGKVVIVTGVSIGGLGFETARVIANHGAGLVILAGRSTAKLDEAEAEIKKETPHANLWKLVIDLASLESVRKAAAEVNEYKEPIDVRCFLREASAKGTLIFIPLCIGPHQQCRNQLRPVFPHDRPVQRPAESFSSSPVAGPYALTSDGLESQFGCNHIGHFLFTNLIRPRLFASPKPRIVNVSSRGHRFGDVRFDDPGFSNGEKYEKWQAYGQAKTANILFSLNVPFLFLQAIWTNLFSLLSVEDQIGMGFLDENGHKYDAGKFTWKTIAAGASTQVVAAFDPDLIGLSGAYLEDTKVATPFAYAIDKVNAEKLWALSEKLVGQTYA
ncbi:hypothetical protein P7C70_g3737, partial [Phenoliferia sp. Uapishka_3]